MVYALSACIAVSVFCLLGLGLLYRLLLLEKERLIASITAVANMCISNTKLYQELCSKTVDIGKMQSVYPGFLSPGSGKKN